MATRDTGYFVTWAGNIPISDTSILVQAALKKHAVLDIELRNGNSILRTASFSAVPGNVEVTFERLRRRASLLSFDVKLSSIPLSLAMKARLFWRKLIRKLESIVFYESWMIGRVYQPIQVSLTWKKLPYIEWIGTREAHRYLADPFALPGDDTVIFCEEFDYKTQLGRLISLEVDGKTITQELEIPPPLPGHLSFPYTFEHEGNIYALPESCSARTLQLFRLEDGHWQLHTTILENKAAADSILFQHAGKFWVAYTDVDIDPFDNLNLCYADLLQGPWQAHAGNPVVLDPRRARCGGTPFLVHGKLYRPAQDCSEVYGGSIRIMEILTCDPERYEEREITHILPEPGLNPHGFHTLSMSGDTCLIDAKRMMFSTKHLMRKIKNRLKL
ncbi:MAG: hypothetical protein U1E36_03210 [Rickettsiales bacterium]